MAETSLVSSLITRVASDQGLRLVAGSNVTPEVTLYDSADDSASLLDLLGVKTYARIEDKSGRVVASYGDTVPLNLFSAVAVWGLVGVVALAILRGIKK